MRQDRRHDPLCDWNLYPNAEDEGEMCNLGCLAHPDRTAATWAYNEARRQERETGGRGEG